MPAFANIIPFPAAITPADGVFTLTSATRITVAPETAELFGLGNYLSEKLLVAIGDQVAPAAATPWPSGNIHLTTLGADPVLGEEGYELTIAARGILLAAPRPAGIFHGIQTLCQLLPEAGMAGPMQTGSWEVAAGTIRDFPRFAWRGVMLDVARHFFSVEDVQRLIELLAIYKLNRLHLHLTDDQGWRIEIRSWPKLAQHGGSIQVGGGPGGYYTQDDYAQIIRHAQKHHIIVIPEVDMPGHTHAALASYPELNCAGVAPALYTGSEVGFSSLCTSHEITYRFAEAVIGEIASLTPGPYLHIGGDEAAATPKPAYIAFVERVQRMVEKHGKQMIGWEEIAAARLAPATVVQYWNTKGQGAELARAAAAQGARVILSPASKAYLDMQYAPGTPPGLNWAGYVEVRDAFVWDPATIVPGLPTASILGVESPLWTETIATIRDVEFLAFPRVAGHAEIGWSQVKQAWETYRLRLAAHGRRWQALGVGFYRSPQVDWSAELPG